MGLAKVACIDIIPDAGPVGGGIIISENGYLFSAAQRHLQHDGDQMGFVIMGLADVHLIIGARHVEITKAYVFNPISTVSPVQQFFNGKLGVSVRVGRYGSCLLPDGNFLRFAVNRGRRRKDHIFYIIFPHFFQN
ncbi:hypothetical protein SDC9_163964 [bioreactor metagenome]|uniref:Uncharacterized protein n=1 Tax=bioreactor metagenome TaxID=1076179 RepID=A0A645FT44_9ZZZZ